MASLPPKIDRRTYEEIVQQTENLVAQITDWKPTNEGKKDAAIALIRIFGRMVKVVSDRLNQVPDKNFLAFLDLIGGELKPAEPAKVPLTFYLAQGSPTDALVPAHTQVSAPPPDGSDAELVFETDRDLIVTRTQLKAVFLHEPSQDTYSDRTLEATGEKDAAFSAFTGDRSIPHSLYITCPEIFALPDLKQFKLIITTNSNNQFPLNWFYWDSSQWQATQTPSLNLSRSNNASTITLTFPNLPIPTFYEIQGKTARWLQANLTNISSISAALPQISNIQGSITIQQSNLIPEVCLFNANPLDLSKDFSPFGEQPSINDTFYISLNNIYIKANTIITININLSRKPTNISNLKISWEIGNGQVWQEIATNNNQLRWIEKSSAIQFTEADTIQAKIQFPNQENLPSPSTVNGETGYWIRARITQGLYGKAADERKYPVYDDLAIIKTAISQAGVREIQVDTLDLFKVGDTIRILPITGGFPEENQINAIIKNDNKLTLKTEVLNPSLAIGTRIMRKSILTETIPAIYDPPVIKSLKLTYEFTLTEKAIYFAENDFTYSYPESLGTQSFQPFKPTLDQEPTLYLGFDKTFDNQTVTLYAQVEVPLPNEILADIPTESPKLVWEYSSSQGWQRLGVQDETQVFSQRGLIKFIAPADFIQKEAFGKQLYWLRVRWIAGHFRVQPRLRRLLTNTTWAVQAISLQEEALGSSNYEQNQVFVASNIPILMGQQLEVQEGKIPPQIKTDCLKVIRDNLGEIQEVWVLWQEVADFYSSSASDRHYILDRQTGKIRFGNGQGGMVPPRGRNNIRLSFYRTGGGKQGNVNPQTINQLKTTIPYIDRVINLEAATGGAQQETLDRLKERVPKQLRHRDRAVTIEDMADLAYEASADVARVKVVPPDLLIANFSSLNEKFWLDPTKPNIPFEDSLRQKLQTTNAAEKDDFEKMMRGINQCAGQVRLIVLPYSSDRQPTPSLALIERVENYIRFRCEATIDLVVTAPQWQEVTVIATITPVSLENADIVRNSVKQRLETFLHPLTGGTGQGWKFGRYPQKSDIYAIIQSISGVDHVNSVELPGIETKPLLSADSLIYSGNHIINLESDT
jgi:hypothetical protein